MPAQCELVGAKHGFGPTDFPDAEYDLTTDAEQAEIILAGGCFWCVEAVLQQLRGVVRVTSGYIGGDADSANYSAVCSGTTGHAEAVQVTYEPKHITLGQILKVFFSVAHDPTQLNRQGNDRGTQYRSAIFPTSEAERDVAERYIAQLNKSGVFKANIATTLEPATDFHRAETHHQNYAVTNPGQPYIQGVSAPKVEKLKQRFADALH